MDIHGRTDSCVEEDTSDKNKMSCGKKLVCLTDEKEDEIVGRKQQDFLSRVFT